MDKKYLAKGTMEVDMYVEFEADAIPAGMDEFEYAHHLADLGHWKNEEPYSGGFHVHEVDLIEQMC